MVCWYESLIQVLSFIGLQKDSSHIWDIPASVTTQSTKQPPLGIVAVVQYWWFSTVVPFNGSVQWFSTGGYGYWPCPVNNLSSQRARKPKKNSSQCFFVQLEGMSWSNIRVSMPNSSITLLQLSIQIENKYEFYKVLIAWQYRKNIVTEKPQIASSENH